MNKVLPLFEGSPKLDVFAEVAPELWVIPVDLRTALESLADIGGEASVDRMRVERDYSPWARLVKRGRCRTVRGRSAIERFRTCVRTC